MITCGATAKCFKLDKNQTHTGGKLTHLWLQLAKPASHSVKLVALKGKDISIETEQMCAMLAGSSEEWGGGYGLTRVEPAATDGGSQLSPLPPIQPPPSSPIQPPQWSTTLTQCISSYCSLSPAALTYPNNTTLCTTCVLPVVASSTIPTIATIDISVLSLLFNSSNL